MAVPSGPGPGAATPGPTGSPTSGATAATPATASAAGTPLLLPEGWTATVTDRIVGTVDSVRAKTTAPVEKLGRALVYGVVLATAGTAALVLLLAFVLRLLHEYVGNIPGIDGREGRSVWLVDLVIAVLLLLVGARFLRKGKQPPPDAR